MDFQRPFNDWMSTNPKLHNDQRVLNIWQFFLMFLTQYDLTFFQLTVLDTFLENLLLSSNENSKVMLKPFF